jgi:type IV secretion/conjugal transfer VirB4 family ATPase
MKTRSITEISPWICPVSDGVVACKDGGLLLSFEITGKDADNMAAVEVEYLLGRIASAVSELRIDPWTVIFTLKNVEDLKYPAASFEIEAAARLDRAHRQYLYRRAALRPRAFLSLHLAPPKKDERFFANIGSMLARGENLARAIYLGVMSSFVGKNAFAYRAEELILALQRLESTADRIVSLLPDLGLRRLLGPDLFGFLRSTVSGHFDNIESTKVRGNWFLDSQLADAPVEVYNDHLKLGDRYVGCFSMKDWPATTSPHLIDVIIASGLPSTTSIAFRLMSKEESKAAIQSLRGYLELTQYGPKQYLAAVLNRNESPDASKADPEKAAALQDVLDASEVLAEKTAFGYMNVSVALYGKAKTELEDAAEFFIKNVASEYPGVVRETLHALSCWAATMPGQLKEPVRWSMMTAHNLADFAPIFLPYRGEPKNPYFEEQTQRPAPALSVFPSARGGHYYFNFHRGALGHTFVIGGSRSGKSVMMNFLISQFTKYMPARVIIFDKDQSCRINTLLHGGAYFDLSAASQDEAKGIPVKINPLHLIGDEAHWEFVSQWVVDLIQSRGFHVTNDHDMKIRQAIEDMARSMDSHQWRLAFLSTLLPGDLRAELAPFVEGGPLASYFDNDRDDFSLAAITAFEMGELLRNERIAPLVMSYAFYRIQRLLEENRRPDKPVVPTFIYLEECWFLFENPVFQERIRDWLKTLAKYGAFCVMATQSIEDMVSENTKFFASIRDNIANMIFLPNPRAATKSVSELYRREFGLSEDVIAEIATSQVRKHYIIVNDDHVKKIECQFTPEQLAYLRSDSLALSILNEEMARGPGWQDRYLRRAVEQ